MYLEVTACQGQKFTTSDVVSCECVAVFVKVEVAKPRTHVTGRPFAHWHTHKQTNRLINSSDEHTHIIRRSRLERKYKLLYKPWAKSMVEGDFRPSTAQRPLDRFSWNLKYITTSRTRLSTQNFRGLCRLGWSGQVASLTHESFCPFYVIQLTQSYVLQVGCDIKPAKDRFRCR